MYTILKSFVRRLAVSLSDTHSHRSPPTRCPRRWRPPACRGGEWSPEVPRVPDRLCAEAIISDLPTRRYTRADQGADQGTDYDGSGACAAVAVCPICLEEFREDETLRTTPCFHAYHRQCIDNWILSGQPGAHSCPKCHHPLDQDRVVPQQV